MNIILLKNLIRIYIFPDTCKILKMSDFEEDDWTPPTEAELKVLGWYLGLQARALSMIS